MRQDQFDLIRKWATEKGIYKKGDVATQFVKLSEEHGELAEAILKEDVDGQIDAIGDMVVVLTNLAELINRENPLWPNINIEVCVEAAWNQIKNRKGSMKNGTFVKE